MNDKPDSGTGNVRSLSDALHRVRTAETERADVVVELRDAERARLEILAEELGSVFDEIPTDNDQFLFTVAPGLPPRLWIDLTSFVVMARDRRTYRFLKDTRLGRTILLETTELMDVADTITNYVAERIIERERAVEGDWLIKRLLQDETTRAKAARLVRRDETADMHSAPTGRGAPAPRAYLGWLAAVFVGGLLAGVVALLATAWIVVGSGS
ncbi:MAG: hypothetical protein ACTSU0_10110 [Alphaproteobacteria bacterium]